MTEHIERAHWGTFFDDLARRDELSPHYLRR
jgi:hypothetical protein